MYRRRELLEAFLAGGIAVTAGCTTFNDDTTSNTTDSRTTDTASSTSSQNVTETTSNTQIRKEDIEFSVERTNESDGGPPKITTYLVNSFDEEIMLSGQSTPPFSSYWSENNADMVLLPTDREYIRPSAPSITRLGEECWKLDEEIKAEHIAIITMLESGDSVSSEHSLVNNVSFELCAEKDTYRFVDEIYLNEQTFSAEVEVEFSDGRLESVSAELS